MLDVAQRKEPGDGQDGAVGGGIRTHCTSKANVAITRFAFNVHNQSTENISMYAMALRDEVQECEYGVTEDVLHRDRIVISRRPWSILCRPPVLGMEDLEPHRRHLGRTDR